jgi:nucleoid-associated protein YgaU
MANEVDAIAAAARTWNEYYSAYQAAYREIFVSRWGIGTASAAQHIHHLAVPDISGQVVGGVSWAAYSQPSRETLLAMLPHFRDLIEREPVRAAANRYLFFVTSGSLPALADVARALGDAAKVIRYSISTIGSELSRPPWQGPIAGSAALGALTLLGSESELLNADSDAKQIVPFAAGLAERREHLEEDAADHILAGAGLVLAAARARLDAAAISQALDRRSWLFGYVATERARLSEWPSEDIAYCEQIRDARGPEVSLYRVRPGDILSRIVRDKYKTSFERLWPMLRAANPEITDPDRIRSGQTIRLPTV